jgi:hypothetical protein
MLPLGQLMATPGALAELERSGTTAMQYILRHESGDWGDVCAEDARANRDALKHGMRILSVYFLPGTNVKIYVITEHDRSCTTLLLAADY